MKKLILLLLCFVSASAFAAPPVHLGPYDPTAARQNNTYTKTEVDMHLSQLEESLKAGSLQLFFRTATDTVTGGRLLSPDHEALVASVAYTALSSTVYVQVNAINRLSVPGIPGVATLSAGIVDAVRYYQTDQAVSTGRTVTGVDELWMVDADGTSNPIFIATSSPYVLSGTEIQRAAYSYSFPADVSTGGITRRFMVKHFRRRTGVLTGANPIVTVWYGGNYEGFMSFALPSAVVMLTTGTNASTTVSFPGRLTTAAGTAAAPAYSFGSDPDTGIYSPGANVLGFGVNGAENARITSGGNVLIGTSADDGVNKLQVNGFTKLGEAATGIKMKVLTGTTAAAEGGTVAVNYGIATGANILSMSAMVLYTANSYILPNNPEPGYNFWAFSNSAEINIRLSATESENILSKPFTILVWYKE